MPCCLLLLVLHLVCLVLAEGAYGTALHRDVPLQNILSDTACVEPLPFQKFCIWKGYAEVSGHFSLPSQSVNTFRLLEFMPCACVSTYCIGFTVLLSENGVMQCS